MLLAIDQGNTNTRFAVHDGSAFIGQWRASTDAARTADEYAVWLTQLFDLQGLKLAAIDACIISSVVPQSVFNLRNLARRYLGGVGGGAPLRQPVLAVVHRKAGVGVALVDGQQHSGRPEEDFAGGDALQRAAFQAQKQGPVGVQPLGRAAQAARAGAGDAGPAEPGGMIGPGLAHHREALAAIPGLEPAG